MKRPTGDISLIKGTLDLLVLKALTWGPQHGYGISQLLEANAAGDLALDDSALYQALHRLEGRRLVQAEWGVTRNNRKARFYTLTAAGRRELEEQSVAFRRYLGFVSRVLALESPIGPGGA